MPESEVAIARQTLSAAQFDQLCGLLRHTAAQLGPECWVLAETDIQGWEQQPLGAYTHLSLQISLEFSVLLLSNRIAASVSTHGASSANSIASPAASVLYHTELMFTAEAIAPILKKIASQVSPQRFHPYSLDTLLAWLSAGNSSAKQASFTLQLFQCLTPSPLPDAPEPQDTRPVFPDSPYSAVCRPVEMALHQRVEQERLLNQVISQIHQSLDLPVILQTAVEQVRQFLRVDRLLIYQLVSDYAYADVQGTLKPEEVANPYRNSVTYEARVSETLPSALGLAAEACFSTNPQLREKYNRGTALRVDEIEVAYPEPSCLLAQLRQLQVRAKLVVPIRVQNQLWGLLIAHQCSQVRRWQDHEEEFLRQIAEHLAIAITQAQLYARLHRQKELLEQRVIERTQHLRDTMLAAQAANRAKMEFLAAMSHELRTPLTSIIGLSSTLMRWVGEELSPRQQQHLETIHTSGRHLLRLINDILDLSQVEAGKVVLRLQDCSLFKLAQQSLKAVQEDAMQHNINLRLDFSPDAEGDRIMIDPQRVQQILLNLLSNAIKFTPPEGQVTLRVTTAEGMALLQVEDTGIGIPREQQPLLFEKFQQLEPSYSRQYGGAGVGLALTRQLVELHGGLIEVQSEVGVGSVFSVRLPMYPHPARSAPSDNRDIPPPSGRVLLIESNEETAGIVCDMLNAAGFQMIWMTEGAVALDQITMLDPLALIINLQVADTNSYDFIRRLRQSEAGAQIKILALSNQFSPTEQQRCLNLGVNAYLAKPLDPQTLLACISRMLTESKA
jgi:two-component system sensor histidine kinase/response regulator